MTKICNVGTFAEIHKHMKMWIIPVHSLSLLTHSNKKYHFAMLLWITRVFFINSQIINFDKGAQSSQRDTNNGVWMSFQYTPKGCSRSSGCRFYLFIRHPYLMRIMMKLIRALAGVVSKPVLHSAHNPPAEGDSRTIFGVLNIVFINCAWCCCTVDTAEHWKGVISGSCWFVRFV